MNGNGQNGPKMIHDPAEWREFTDVLDAAYRHWDAADQLAAARDRLDDERNAEADKRAWRYDKLKRECRRILYEPLTPMWIDSQSVRLDSGRRGGVQELRNVR
jgi:hypothetical protein